MKKYFRVTYKPHFSKDIYTDLFTENQLFSPYGAARYIDNLGGVSIKTGEEYLEEALRDAVINIDDSESAEYNVEIIKDSMERFEDSMLDADIPLQDMIVISWTDKNLEGQIVAGDKNNMAQLLQAAFDKSKDADTLDIEEISEDEYNSIMEGGE